MELSSEELLNWRNQPTSKKFFKYLADYADAQANIARDLILDGIEPDIKALQRTTIECGVLQDIMLLNFVDIDSFYNPENYDTNNESLSGEKNESNTIKSINPFQAEEAGRKD